MMSVASSLTSKAYENASHLGHQASLTATSIQESETSQKIKDSVYAGYEKAKENAAYGASMAR